MNFLYRLRLFYSASIIKIFFVFLGLLLSVTSYAQFRNNYPKTQLKIAADAGPGFINGAKRSETTYGYCTSHSSYNTTSIPISNLETEIVFINYVLFSIKHRFSYSSWSEVECRPPADDNTDGVFCPWNSRFNGIDFMLASSPNYFPLIIGFNLGYYWFRYNIEEINHSTINDWGVGSVVAGGYLGTAPGKRGFNFNFDFRLALPKVTPLEDIAIGCVNFTLGYTFKKFPLGIYGGIRDVYLDESSGTGRMENGSDWNYLSYYFPTIGLTYTFKIKK